MLCINASDFPPCTALGRHSLTIDRIVDNTSLRLARQLATISPPRGGCIQYHVMVILAISQVDGIEVPSTRTSVSQFCVILDQHQRV
jgi:hypothetical protein